MSHLNIEWKAVATNADEQEKILQQYNPRFIGEDLQTDTYFETKRGRLKIREGNIENALIWYERENLKGSKASQIILFKYDPNPGLRHILTITNGVKIVVKKKRRIYFIDNVKFHFDEIDSLGKFIETEAIDTSDTPDIEKLQEQCKFYAGILNIKNEDYVKDSYSDLLINK